MWPWKEIIGLFYFVPNENIFDLNMDKMWTISESCTGTHCIETSKKCKTYVMHEISGYRIQLWMLVFFFFLGGAGCRCLIHRLGNRMN